MSQEQSIITHTSQPRTRDTIIKDLQQLGIKPGMTLLVHSSLSKIGWTSGGAVAVIQALMDVVTKEGTIVMPSQSPVLSDPSEWENPPVPEEWWQTIRDTMPAFDSRFTPTNGMGTIVEVFRTMPGVERSNHPAVSFAAWGRKAEEITSSHPIDYSLGDHSPLGHLYECDADVLFIGTGYDTCTAFHLAEYRIAHQKKVQKGAPIFENEGRIWKEFEDIHFRDELFEGVGRKLEQDIPVVKGQIGSAESKRFSMSKGVDVAVDWLNAYDQMYTK